jgi:glycosyltransferase involved in cell wall biosynthesis
LFKKDQIDRLAVVKKGLELVFTTLTQKKVYRIHPNSRSLENTKSKRESEKIQIGVFSNYSYNKNRHNQVAAALMVENSEVHILGNNEFSYFGMDERIKIHKELEREEFLNLVGSMDVNLYLSYSESWGQVVTESVSKGVPCLTSNSSGIYDCNKSLSEQLVINENDNPIEISKQLMKVLKFDFQNEFTTYLETLNENSETLTSEFLNSY